MPPTEARSSPGSTASAATPSPRVRRRSRELQAARRISGHRLLDPASLARIEERIDAERESRRLYRALDGLNDDDRKLLELVALDGLSVADAARSLGVKPATARVRLHRSRARITTTLRGSEPDPGPVRALTPEVTL